MREYGMVYSAFWTSTSREGFSDDAKLLGAYLLSCSHGTIAGAFRLPDAYVSDDLNWTIERVSKGFGELLSKGFANRCMTTKWVWIRKFLEWNKPENPNQWKAVKKVVAQIPTQCTWLAEFSSFFRKLMGRDSEPDPNPPASVPQTLSKSHTHSDPHSDTHQIPNPTQNGSAAEPPGTAVVPRGTRSKREEPEWLEPFKAIYPKRAGDPNWRGAIRAGNGRLQQKYTVEQFLEGARRYAAFIAATDRTGTEFVMQASRFLGPSMPFLESWDLPPSKGQRQQDATIDAGRQFLRDMQS